MEKVIVDNLRNRSIFLTGFMGSGKTTVGKALSQRLEIPFFDLDRQIEAVCNRQISEIFINEGESAFRKFEHETLCDLLSISKPRVISLGGGALLEESSRVRVRKSGVLITLHSSTDYIIRNLNEKQIKTLLIMTGKPLDGLIDKKTILDSVNELYKQREKVYNDCDFSVITKGRRISDIVDEIIRKLELLHAE
jgi:shikimate kinase